MHDQEKDPQVARVESIANINIDTCYQCGKCTAGCPVGDKMDAPPATLMRMVQNGEVDEATQCDSIWLCVSCQTCSERCPKETNPAGVIDALREIMLEQGGIPSKETAPTLLFQQEFLRNIRNYGRTNELRLVMAYKLFGFSDNLSVSQLLADSMLGPAMLRRSKLHVGGVFGGKAIKDIGIVKRIFKKCEAE